MCIRDRLHVVHDQIVQLAAIPGGGNVLQELCAHAGIGGVQQGGFFIQTPIGVVADACLLYTSGGVLQTVHETDDMVRYPAVGMDLPLNAPCFPVDQTIRDGQAVNFGYMLRPPHGDKMCIRDRSWSSL